MIREIQYAEFIEEKPFVKEWINDKGQEVLSDKPVAIPLRQQAAPSSLIDLINQMYRQLQISGNDVETFDDANDFDIPDELGIEMKDTPYEQDFDHLESSAAPSEEPPAVSDEPEKVTE